MNPDVHQVSSTALVGIMLLHDGSTARCIHSNTRVAQAAMILHNRSSAQG